MTAFDLVKKYFPNVSDDDADDLIWCVTAFPAGDWLLWERQLKEAADNVSHIADDLKCWHAIEIADQQIRDAMKQ